MMLLMFIGIIDECSIYYSGSYFKFKTASSYVCLNLIFNFSFLLEKFKYCLQYMSTAFRLIWVHIYTRTT